MFLRSPRIEKTLVVLLAWISLFVSIPVANAAPIILNSSLGTGCMNSYINSWFQSNRYIATSDVSISAINYLIGNGSSTNFNTARLHIFSDNPTGPYPNNILATFTPDSLNGSGTSRVAKFVGSQYLSAGTKFWIVSSVRTDVLPWCNWNGATTSGMTLNGIVPDTSTSNSNSSFRRANSSSSTLPIASTWSTTENAALIWQLSIEASSVAMSATLALQNGTNRATFRTTTSIVASVSGNSKVTFYVNKKVIPKCRNILSSSGVASCNWSPSFTGVNSITANVISLDPNYSNGSAKSVDILVSKRSNKR